MSAIFGKCQRCNQQSTLVQYLGGTCVSVTLRPYWICFRCKIEVKRLQNTRFKQVFK